MPPATNTETDPAAAITARLPVTDRRAWTLLLAVALLVLAGLAWAILGRAPEIVRGPGMIVPAGGFADVGTTTDGSVTSVLVTPGEEVVAGQPLATLETSDGTTEEITSTVAGTVATIVARQGGATEPGVPLLTIDPIDSGNVAVGFLPADRGGQVRPGMAALVAVSSLPQAQYGYLTGTVRSIALLPATADRVRHLVGGNEQLAEFFLAGGPIVEITVDLDVDPSTPSGYAWTTGDGPDAEVATGSLAQVSVVLSDRSPLERITG